MTQIACNAIQIYLFAKYANQMFSYFYKMANAHNAQITANLAKTIFKIAHPVLMAHIFLTINVLLVPPQDRLAQL